MAFCDWQVRFAEVGNTRRSFTGPKNRAQVGLDLAHDLLVERASSNDDPVAY